MSKPHTMSTGSPDTAPQAVQTVWKVLLSLLIFIGVLFPFTARWYIATYTDQGFAAILFTLTNHIGGTSGSILGSWVTTSVLPALAISVLACSLLWALCKPRGTKEPGSPSLASGGSSVSASDGNGVSAPAETDVTAAGASDAATAGNEGAAPARSGAKTPSGNRAATRTSRIPRVLPFWACTAISLVIFVGGVCGALVEGGIVEFIANQLDSTQIYEAEYVDPASVEITFPEEKRNLVFVFLESMETSFASHDEGGALAHNTIPELMTLAAENTSFSHDEGVGGWTWTEGATCTMAALVAESAGIPYEAPLESTKYSSMGSMLAGARSINDILHDAGYAQAVMFGSDASFAGRDVFYKTHSIDRIYDVYTAREDGIIAPDYWYSWGFEDAYLYEYAEQVIGQMAESEEPFCFTMLTVDTHFPNGSLCDNCESEYDEQLENVYACASRQFSAFASWLEDQDFWENTTLVVCGDHHTMDAAYLDRAFDPSYERHVYNCFVNSARTATDEQLKNRTFTPFDIFPTTLAALGCTIEEDRLALGANLFSDVETLAERVGMDELNSELAKNSSYYNSNFLK